MSLGGIAKAAANSAPGINIGPGTGELPSASIADNVAFNALVVVPNALQGLFRRRAGAVRAATRADVDRWAIRLLRGMNRAHGGSPVWVRLGTSRALLLLDVADVRRLLEGSPDPFASDPEAKRKGMSHFQPDALTISRDGEWLSRRPFNESVLATGEALHPLADRFATVADEEIAVLVGDGGVELDWDGWAAAFRHIARRIVLGDAARNDEELSDLLATLMDEANSLPDDPSENFPAYTARLERYVETAEDGSLIGLFAAAPRDEHTKPARQVTHWLFAIGDTLAINCFRALAVLATHPEAFERARAEIADAGASRRAVTVGELDYLSACLEDAMRLWPTTPILSREAVRETDWRGVAVAKGTQFLFVNAFMHRDPDRHAFADRFAPEVWLDGDAADDWAFNHLSHGPQGCPGADLASFVGKTALACAIRGRSIELIGPSLDPAKPLPHMLDFFSIRVLTA
jgi:cytochrome P450